MESISATTAAASAATNPDAYLYYYDVLTVSRFSLSFSFHKYLYKIYGENSLSHFFFVEYEKSKLLAYYLNSSSADDDEICINFFYSLKRLSEILINLATKKKNHFKSIKLIFLKPLLQ